MPVLQDLFTPIAVDPATTVLIVLAACIVYNFLRDERSSSSCDETPSDIMDLPRNIQPVTDVGCKSFIERQNGTFKT